jgi:hypothetical protein
MNNFKVNVTNDFRSNKIADRLLTSYDEIFYSQLQDDSEVV